MPFTGQPLDALDRMPPEGSRQSRAGARNERRAACKSVPRARVCFYTERILTGESAAAVECAGRNPVRCARLKTGWKEDATLRRHGRSEADSCRCSVTWGKGLLSEFGEPFAEILNGLVQLSGAGVGFGGVFSVEVGRAALRLVVPVYRGYCVLL